MGLECLRLNERESAQRSKKRRRNKDGQTRDRSEKQVPCGGLVLQTELFTHGEFFSVQGGPTKGKWTRRVRSAKERRAVKVTR